MRALKVLHGQLLYKLTDHSDRIAKAGSGDCLVYKASNNLSEPFLIASRSGVGTNLEIPAKGCEHWSVVGHAELVQHIQHVMSLEQQYVVRGMDHVDPLEVMKVPQVLQFECIRQMGLHSADFNESRSCDD